MRSTDTAPPLPKIGMLWIGPKLGIIEQLSLLSFLEHGHAITLFTTETVSGVPLGVTVKDANEIFPSKTILRHHKTGSAALHSDLFRYALLAKTDLMWVDLDVLCIRPYRPHNGYVFGYEDENTINGAVLRLPPESPALQQLLQYQADTTGYPPFFSLGRKVRYWLRSGAKAPHISRWPWGAIGPKGLTFHLQQTGEIQHAQAQSAFYHISLNTIEQLTQADALSRDTLAPEVFYLHLWGKELRQAMQKQAPQAGSFLAQEMQRLGQRFGVQWPQ